MVLASVFRAGFVVLALAILALPAQAVTRVSQFKCSQFGVHPPYTGSATLTWTLGWVPMVDNGNVLTESWSCGDTAPNTPEDDHPVVQPDLANGWTVVITLFGGACDRCFWSDSGSFTAGGNPRVRVTYNQSGVAKAVLSVGHVVH